MKIVLMTSGTINSSITYRALSFAKALSKLGHDVYIVSPKFDKYSKFKPVKIKKIGNITIVNPYQLKNVPFVVSLIPYIISSLYKLLVLNPDVVHIFKANPITVGGLFERFLGKKVLLDIDDLDAEVMKIEDAPFIMIKLVDLSSQIAEKFSSSISVASLYLLKKYKNKYKGKKIIYVPNGAEFNKKIETEPKKKAKIVFIGNMNRKNILEPLFFAMKNLTSRKIEVRAEIIGNGIFLQYFKKLAGKLKVSHAISFRGYVERENLNKYMSGQDIGYCYMPNDITIKACSSMKVFQYMQNGVIPLVSNVGDLPFYTFHGEAGYIAKPDNIESLTTTLLEALKNNADRNKKLLFGIKYAKASYSWDTLTRKIISAYK